ncbi:MAG: hypothetical protein WBY67_17590, partial [Pseudolabrys sp.]
RCSRRDRSGRSELPIQLVNGLICINAAGENFPFHAWRNYASGSTGCVRQCSERTEDTTGMSAAAPFGRCAETQARTGIQNMDDPRTRRLLIALLIGIVLFAAGMAQHYLL